MLQKIKENNSTNNLDYNKIKNYINEVKDDINIVLDNYISAYDTIIKFFNIENLRKEDCVILAHVVYGWMPTILKNNEINDEIFQIISDGLKKEEFNENFYENVCKITNNSIVGGSKFLHFLKPDYFPIYDSNIINSLNDALKESKFKFKNDIESYIVYLSLINKIQDEIDLEKFYKNNEKNIKKIREYTKTRIIEMILFYDWKKIKKLVKTLIKTD